MRGGRGDGNGFHCAVVKSTRIGLDMRIYDIPIFWQIRDDGMEKLYVSGIGMFCIQDEMVGVLSCWRRYEFSGQC